MGIKMPYIPQDRRYIISEASNAGELNFLITRLLSYYLQDHGLSYGTINDVMGALSGAQAEFYRRVAVPYEDQKIKDNGDAYPSDLIGNCSECHEPTSHECCPNGTVAKLGEE